MKLRRVMLLLFQWLTLLALIWFLGLFAICDFLEGQENEDEE